MGGGEEGVFHFRIPTKQGSRVAGVVVPGYDAREIELDESLMSFRCRLQSRLQCFSRVWSRHLRCSETRRANRYLPRVWCCRRF